MRRLYPQPTAAEIARRVGVIRAAARDRCFEWVELSGPAVLATCKILGIAPVTARNLDAYVFNHD